MAVFAAIAVSREVSRQRIAIRVVGSWSGAMEIPVIGLILPALEHGSQATFVAGREPLPARPTLPRIRSSVKTPRADACDNGHDGLARPRARKRLVR